GIEVLATELYGNARLSRDETLARLLEHADGGSVTLYEPNDWKAPYASGSAKVDAYVVCPCSMGTLGTIASGAMSNLIHRAVSVETGMLAPDGVRTMFDRIAPVYDAMNRLMTAGLDRRWRRLTVAAVVRPGDRVLDACCGTGDLAIAAREAGAEVTGLDFSER